MLKSMTLLTGSKGTDAVCSERGADNGNARCSALFHCTSTWYGCNRGAHKSQKLKRQSEVEDQPSQRNTKPNKLTQFLCTRTQKQQHMWALETYARQRTTMFANKITVSFDKHKKVPQHGCKRCSKPQSRRCSGHRIVEHKKVKYTGKWQEDELEEGVT